MNKANLTIEIAKLVAGVTTAFGADPKDTILQEALFEECFNILKKKFTPEQVYRAKARILRREKQALRDQMAKLASKPEENRGDNV